MSVRPSASRSIPTPARHPRVCAAARAAIEPLEARRLLTTYYVDADAAAGGNGLTTGTAFNSIAQVEATVLAAGDSVLFQRGDTWRDQLDVKQTGTSANRITYGAYGTGAQPRILGSDVIPGPWTAEPTANVWSAAIPWSIASGSGQQGPRIVTVNDQPSKLEPAFNSSSLGPGEHYYSTTTNRVFIYATADPDATGAVVDGARRGNSIKSGVNHDFITIDGLETGRSVATSILNNDESNDWIIRNNTVRYVSASGNSPVGGIQLGNRALVQDNVVDFYVGDAIYAQSATDVHVIGNTITRMYAFGYNYVGDAIQITGGNPSFPPSRFRVEDNYIDIRGTDSGKGAIMTEFGADGVIARNRVMGGKFGIEVNADRNVVEQNVISDIGANGGIRSANSNSSDGIVIRNNLVYDVSASGIFLTDDTGATDKVRSNMKIYNNTLVNTGGVSLSNMAISGEFRNNIVQGGSGDYQLSIGKIIAGQQFLTSNNVYNPLSASSSKVMKVGASEASVSLTPGTTIKVNGVSTGVTAAVNTGYNVLMRIDYATSGNTINAWVNPDFALGESGLGAPQAVAVTAANWGIKSVATSHSSDANNESGFDNIRMGNAFADATGTGAPLVEETFTYAANAPLYGLNGGAGWGGAWEASNTFSKVNAAGTSVTTKGDTKRQLATKISKTTGSSWVLVRLSGQSTSRTGTFQLHDDAGASFFSVAAAQAGGIESGSAQGDPGFVDAANKNFHLASGSVAINAGLTLPGVTLDFESDARDDGATDIGADERRGLLVYEPFDYASGTVAGQNGGTGFAGAWTVAGGAGGNNVVAGSLNYTDAGGNVLATAGGRLQLFDSDGSNNSATRVFNQNFGAANGTVWMSFEAVKISTSREARASFDGFNFRAAGGNWLVKTTDTTEVDTGVPISSTAKLFVVKLDFTSGTDTATVWVNPSLAAAPSAGTAVATIVDATGFLFDSVTFSHGPFGNSPQRGEWDELRIGSSFADVAPIAGGSLRAASGGAGTGAQQPFAFSTTLITTTSNKDEERMVGVVG